MIRYQPILLILYNTMLCYIHHDMLPLHFIFHCVRYFMPQYHSKCLISCHAIYIADTFLIIIFTYNLVTTFFRSLHEIRILISNLLKVEFLSIRLQQIYNEFLHFLHYSVAVLISPIWWMWLPSFT